PALALRIPAELQDLVVAIHFLIHVEHALRDVHAEALMAVLDPAQRRCRDFNRFSRFAERKAPSHAKTLHEQAEAAPRDRRAVILVVLGHMVTSRAGSCT